MGSQSEQLEADLKLEKEEANNWKKEYETTNEQSKKEQKKSEANNEFPEVKSRLGTKITDEKIVQESTIPTLKNQMPQRTSQKEHGDKRHIKEIICIIFK